MNQSCVSTFKDYMDAQTAHQQAQNPVKKKMPSYQEE